MEVLTEITKKVNNLDDENGRCMARIKDLKNENDSCIERVKQLQKGDDKHIEIIKYLEKENDIYKVREKKIYACFCCCHSLQCCWLLVLHLVNDLLFDIYI